MKKRSVLCIFLLSVAIMVLSGTTWAAGLEKPVELKFSHWMSPMHSLHTDVFTPWAKEVEEKTKGRVKITIYPGEALGKSKDHYEMAVNGISDISYIIQGYTPGRFPLSAAIELPFMVSSAKVGSQVLWELYPKYLKSEYPGVKVITLWTHGPGHVHMTNKLVKNLEDIKGIRLRSPGPQQTLILKEFGASPLTIPMPELYNALQRGMADGAVAPFSVLSDIKLYELMRYHTVANLYVMAMGIVMNQKAWDSLPPDIQSIIDGLSGARLAEIAGKSYDHADELGREAAKKVGAQIYTLDPAEMKRWADRIIPLNEKWVKDMETKGLPGAKILADAQSLCQKYSK